jgi:hypothetical protein
MYVCMGAKYVCMRAKYVCMYVCMRAKYSHYINVVLSSFVRVHL